MSKEENELSEQLEEESIEKIKDNAKLVLKNNYKYYAFLDLGRNIKKLLSEGDNIKTVEKEMVDELMNICYNDIEKMKRFHEKHILYIFHIRKPNKEEKDDAVECKRKHDEKGYVNLCKIKGRLLIAANTYNVLIDAENKKKPISIENLNAKGYSMSSIYWLNNRYLKKYDEVPVLHMKKILYLLPTGSPLAIRKMSDVIKKKQPYGLTASRFRKKEN